VEIDGGAISNFHLVEKNLNPLSWREASSTPGPQWKGHFLCLDRWGSPSDAEGHNGMPFHGEASRVEWKILYEPVLKNGQIVAEMAATLPLAGLTVRRQIRLSEKDSFFTVREEITNTQKLGRLQRSAAPDNRATLSGRTTVVDANGEKDCLSPSSNPEEPTVSGRRRLKTESLLI
jgi:hypothetical protein